ncbi:hypothetical protein NLI96_g9762 [Meripilus lineatus]|uniref:O-methylsterigmatocystin oxidoreductase n=1 Tax=Meripilus lineatus TaxID=2056292 RepID=A0AAD5UX39_9APHY|nr:hypothetical protein NLI96_g9762 [Physisporinus lineatus]
MKRPIATRLGMSMSERNSNATQQTASESPNISLRNPASKIAKLSDYSPPTPGGVSTRLSFVARNLIKVMYGYTIKKSHDRLLAITEQAVVLMTQAATPGAFLVDTFPLLKYVPSWFPGAGFRRKAEEWKQLTLEVLESPFNDACGALEAGRATPCFVTDLTTELEDAGADPTQFETLRNCAAVGYSAGADTSSHILRAFFLAMSLYPDVQEKARSEINTVCIDRLPDFRDRASLPYTDALCTELVRWATIAPIGFPRATTQDDVYRGYFIPAGTIILENVWYVNVAIRHLRLEETF